MTDTTSSRIIKNALAAKEDKFARLARESKEILDYEAKRAGEVGYLSSTIVQCTLPYREPKGNPSAWGRTNGRVSLTIQPGMYITTEKVIDAKGKERRRNVPVSMGYPYGSIPRLLLAWVGKEVTRTHSREISLGKTLTDFMTDIGINSITGGKRGSITAVKEQTKRLFSATIALVDDPDVVDWSNDGFRLADRLSVWWDPAAPPEQGTLFDSKVVLSERFYEEILRSPVPLDMRALRALKQSPLSLDLYSWISYRSYSCTRPTRIPWEALKQQFGTETESERKFRSLIRKALIDVQMVYPGARFDASDSKAFILLPGDTSVVKVAGSKR